MSDEYRLEVDGIIVATPKTKSELLSEFEKHRGSAKKSIKAQERQEDGYFKTLAELEVRYER